MLFEVGYLDRLVLLFSLLLQTKIKALEIHKSTKKLNKFYIHFKFVSKPLSVVSEFNFIEANEALYSECRPKFIIANPDPYYIKIYINQKRATFSYYIFIMYVAHKLKPAFFNGTGKKI